MIYTQCGYESKPAHRHCVKCGQRLVPACTACDKSLTADASFCFECGTKVTSADVATSSGEAAAAGLQSGSESSEVRPIKTIEFLGKASTFQHLEQDTLAHLLAQM